jgi:CheY-like chemotaxis protein
MKKILLVDDERDVRDFVAKRLSKENYSVLTAQTGEEALRVCRSEHPDLVLLDIAIPEKDGYKICKELKEDPQTKDILVIFMTGQELTSEGISKRCEALGAEGYIKKPCSLKELLAQVNSALEDS